LKSIRLFGFRVAAEIARLLSGVLPAFRQNAVFEEADMRLRRAILSSLLFIAIVACAQAEDGQRDRGATPAAQLQTRRPVLTGKERLGPKWTDEQRIDNCNVPIDRRGNKPRPSACANGPSS
jgi:hypothetical protein